MSTVFSEGQARDQDEGKVLYQKVLHLACKFTSFAGQDLPAALEQVAGKRPDWAIVLRALLLKQEKCLVEAGRLLQSILQIGRTFEAIKKGHVTEGLQAAEAALDNSSHVTKGGPGSPNRDRKGNQGPDFRRRFEHPN